MTAASFYKGALIGGTAFPIPDVLPGCTAVGERGECAKTQ